MPFLFLALLLSENPAPSPGCTPDGGAILLHTTACTLYALLGLCALPVFFPLISGLSLAIARRPAPEPAAGGRGAGSLGRTVHAELPRA